MRKTVIPLILLVLAIIPLYPPNSNHIPASRNWLVTDDGKEYPIAWVETLDTPHSRLRWPVYGGPNPWGGGYYIAINSTGFSIALEMNLSDFPDSTHYSSLTGYPLPAYYGTYNHTVHFTLLATANGSVNVIKNITFIDEPPYSLGEVQTVTLSHFIDAMECYPIVNSSGEYLVVAGTWENKLKVAIIHDTSVSWVVDTGVPWSGHARITVINDTIWVAGDSLVSIPLGGSTATRYYLSAKTLAKVNDFLLVVLFNKTAILVGENFQILNSTELPFLPDVVLPMQWNALAIQFYNGQGPWAGLFSFNGTRCAFHHVRKTVWLLESNITLAHPQYFTGGDIWPAIITYTGNDNSTAYTRIYIRDSDMDGLLDGWEQHNSHTSRYDPDTDGDGLDDFEESMIHGTDGTKVDTDGDGLTDYDEIVIHGTNALKGDTDGDGLSDYGELNEYHTDPLNPDTDGDVTGSPTTAS